MSLRFSHPKTRRHGLVHKLIGQIESKPASDRFILRIIFFGIVGSIIAVLIIWNSTFTVSTAVGGGTLIEGLIGTPRFINPALAVTRADQDVTALVYAGLMKINPEGNLVPHLAESVTVSADGKTYNVILRKNLSFHDNTPLTANDVAFTIGLIQNPALKSPARGNWSDISVEVISDTEMNIILRQAYTPFIENFTLGILPKHIWNTLPIEQIPFSKFNTEPIGAGPFAIDHIVRNTTGMIDRYILSQFTKNESVKLHAVELRFFQNEDDITSALQQKDIMSTVYLQTSDIKKFTDNTAFTTIKEPLPRIFGVFFNQNKSPILRDTTVRLALNAAIDRSLLVDTALAGYGVPTLSPVPQTTATVELASQSTEAIDSASSSVEKAVTILIKGGWVKNTSGTWEKRIDGQVENLHITIRTANTPLFEQATEVIARSWRELGVEVQVEQYEQSDVLQSVIRPRDFEALLFGLDMSRAVDLYPFWHSSQREDPGLNISQYANIEVDTLLERARIATSSDDRNQANNQIVSILSREMPATILFAPYLVYVLDAAVITTPIATISKPHERFMNISEWHMNTDALWPFFR